MNHELLTDRADHASVTDEKYADGATCHQGVEPTLHAFAELRAAFRDRVKRGLDSLMTSGAVSVLLVSHKGVIRTIGEQLLEHPQSDGPELGGVVSLSRGANDAWFEGRRGSNPPGLDTEVVS